MTGLRRPGRPADPRKDNASWRRPGERWKHFVAELQGAYQPDRRRTLVDFYRTEMRGRPYLKIIGWRWIDRGPVYWLLRLSWSFVQFLLAAMLSLFVIETTALVLMSRVLRPCFRRRHFLWPTHRRPPDRLAVHMMSGID